MSTLPVDELKTLRISLKVTPKEVAKELDVTLAKFQRWERRPKTSKVNKHLLKLWHAYLQGKAQAVDTQPTEGATRTRTRRAASGDSGSPAFDRLEAKHRRSETPAEREEREARIEHHASIASERKPPYYPGGDQ